MKKETKDKVLRIRMTTSMYEELKEIAQKKGIDVSKLIRKIIEERSDADAKTI